MTFRALQNSMGVLEICFSNMILIEKSVDYILNRLVLICAATKEQGRGSGE